MGSIRGYSFQSVLLVGLNDEVPPFDDDTLVVVCSDDDPNRGKLIPFTEWYAELVTPEDEEFQKTENQEWWW